MSILYSCILVIASLLQYLIAEGFEEYVIPDRINIPAVREHIEKLMPIHDMCINETNTDENLVYLYNELKYIDDENLKCYMNCILDKSGHLYEDGSINYDKLILSIENPTHRRFVKRMVLFCKKYNHGDQKCEIAFNFNECLIYIDPTNYYLV